MAKKPKTSYKSSNFFYIFQVFEGHSFGPLKRWIGDL